MYTRDEVRELLETGTVRRTKVRSAKSEVKSQRPEVETLPRAALTERAVRVVSGRHHSRVHYVLVPDSAGKDAVMAGTLGDLADIEGVTLSPYLPAGCAVVRTIQV